MSFWTILVVNSISILQNAIKPNIMDNIDMGILGILLDNCREPDRSIGSRLNRTGGVISGRRRHMEDTGVIQRYAVKVEPPLFGFGVLYVVVTGEDTDEILGQCRLIGKPYLVVPCVGGITVCGVVVEDGRDMQQKVELAKGLMRDVRILTIFEADDPVYGYARLTRTDLKVLGNLVSHPRQKNDATSAETGLSVKTVMRCREKLQANPNVQFTLTYDPQRLEGYIPYVVLAWVRGSPAGALPGLNKRLSQHYLQAPFVAKSQIVLFMYCRTVFEMDDMTRQVRETDAVESADLFIPKKITLYDEWLADAIRDLERSPKLHIV